MIKYCLKKWDKNHNELREVLKNDTTLNSCDYKYLVELMVTHILNIGDDNIQWDANSITEIDNGDYQGTLLFVIPLKTYQPSEYEHLMTFISYGSCSCCDTLQSIQNFGKHVPPTNEQVNDYMMLCKDLLTNTIKPYNSGWRFDEDFTEV